MCQKSWVSTSRESHWGGGVPLSPMRDLSKLLFFNKNRGFLMILRQRLLREFCKIWKNAKYTKKAIWISLWLPKMSQKYQKKQKKRLFLRKIKLYFTQWKYKTFKTFWKKVKKVRKIDFYPEGKDNDIGFIL